MPPFEHLFEPLNLRGHKIRNRILSTGHQTYLAKGGLVSEDLVAYHEARARGGVGLIIAEAARFHPTALSESPEIVVTTDACIPGYRMLAKAAHQYDVKLFGQLSHSGRLSRRMSGGFGASPMLPPPCPTIAFIRC